MSSLGFTSRHNLRQADDAFPSLTAGQQSGLSSRLALLAQREERLTENIEKLQERLEGLMENPGTGNNMRRIERLERRLNQLRERLQRVQVTEGRLVGAAVMGAAAAAVAVKGSGSGCKNKML